LKKRIAKLFLIVIEKVKLSLKRYPVLPISVRALTFAKPPGNPLGLVPQNLLEGA
jgi:hypothetical protein